MVRCGAAMGRSRIFSATCEIHDGTTFHRRLLPCISLCPDMRDTLGKTMALLWAIWLACGPSWSNMKAFTSRVVGIITDLGVEHRIASMEDVLADFFWLIDPGHAVDVEPGPRLWPFALCVPGWKHAWDLMLQKCLASQMWFPSWLSKFKKSIGFFRSKSNIMVLRTLWRRQRLFGLAETLKRASFPHFANWRWNTLYLCLKAWDPIQDSVRQHFSVAPFGRNRDRAEISAVNQALHCEQWHLYEKLLLYVCTWLGDLLAWGAGCDCHEHLLVRGEEVECVYKGRRLQTEWGHINQELNRVLQEANTWSFGTWRVGGPQGHLQFQGAIRGTVLLARRKFSWLNRVPFLFARLSDPGVAAICLTQWMECNPDDHHPLTRKIMEPGWLGIGLGFKHMVPPNHAHSVVFWRCFCQPLLPVSAGGIGHVRVTTIALYQ